MIKKILYVCLFIVAFVMFLSNHAAASRIDLSILNIDEFRPGNETSPYESVEVKFNSTSHDVLSGEFDVKLSFFDNNTLILEQLTFGYCVDFYGAANDLENIKLDPLTGSSTYDSIGKTYDYHGAAWLMDQYAAANTNPSQHTALQLAIWKSIYDTDFTYSTVKSPTEDTIDHYYEQYIDAYNTEKANTNPFTNLTYTYNIVTPKSIEVPDNFQEIIIRTVPEPSSMVLFGIGLLGLGAIGRKRRI